MISLVQRSVSTKSAPSRKADPENDIGGKGTTPGSSPSVVPSKKVVYRKPTQSWLALVYDAFMSRASPSEPDMTRAEIREVIAMRNPYYKSHHTELYAGIYHPLAQIHRFYQVERADGTPAWGLTAGWHIDSDSGHTIEQDKDVDDVIRTSHDRPAVEAGEEEEPRSHMDNANNLRAELLAGLATPRPVCSSLRQSIDGSDTTMMAFDESGQANEATEAEVADEWETTDSEILSGDSEGSPDDDDRSFITASDGEGDSDLETRSHRHLPADQVEDTQVIDPRLLGPDMELDNDDEEDRSGESREGDTESAEDHIDVDEGVAWIHGV